MNAMENLTLQEQKSLLRFKKEVRFICSDRCEIKVFGSRARMEGNKESDIDILVLIEKEDERKKIKIWDAAYVIFSETDIMISPLVLSQTQYDRLKKGERLIAKNIEEEGFAL